MRPQSRVEHGHKYPQAERKGQSHIKLAYGSLVSTSTIFNLTRGKRICGRLQSFNLHAEQERSELSGTGHSTGIRKLYNGDYSHRRNANEEATVYVSDLDVFVSKSSRIRPQSWRLVNCAKITDVPMSGPVVKNHTLLTVAGHPM